MSEEQTIVDINKVSPMMQEYIRTKEKYKDCILFYRLGDFYELFYDDAIKISQVLDLTLTGKNCGDGQRAPMCGVPYHAADGYISKLVAQGYKVAICEQMTDPKPGKIVERDVIKVVTPGTVTEDSMLDEKKNNFLMCLAKKNELLSVCYCDITTGDLTSIVFKENLEENFTDLLNRISPSQIIGNGDAKNFYGALNIHRLGNYPKFEQYFDYAFEIGRCEDNITRQFGENADSVFELKKDDKYSLGALLEYLQDTQKRSLKNICKVTKVKNVEYMTIDSNTRRNLELVETIRDHKKYGSLLWLLDKTKTSMGARFFRLMFDQPLQNSTLINERLDAVEELTKNLIMRDRLSDALSKVRDVERICGKIAYGSVTPVELFNFKLSLSAIPEIKDLIKSVRTKKLVSLYEKLDTFDEIVELLDKAIPDRTLRADAEEFIKHGFNEELDSLRDAKQTAQMQCDKLQELEREQTGIKNLKIGYNSVFGFYIEVTKSFLEQVPLRYKRKQTLAGCERYITEDLKKIEERFLSSKEESEKLEKELFSKIVEYLCGFLEKFSGVAKVIAEIDAILSLAQTAIKQNFVRPTINRNTNRICITEGRHPIVERFAKDGSFIANDTLLDSEENQMMIITGPNMAGKSTYMRQVALIIYLAHIGSFVPAKSAEIAITDRIFTRVGASDDLAFGQSTFMVEMSEVANILANATDKSLVILDEIGRGTSTFDGLSIAWAVVEYLAKNFKCKTLFATHYHELSELEGLIVGVKNYQIAVKELGDSIVFLRKITRGHANKSFGVEVAKLAGVPQKVISRAKEISVSLEKANEKLDASIFGENEERTKKIENNKLGQQILSILRDLDINKLSPMESFEILNDLIEKVKD